jgi:hypothetical protein
VKIKEKALKLSQHCCYVLNIILFLTRLTIFSNPKWQTVSTIIHSKQYGGNCSNLFLNKNLAGHAYLRKDIRLIEAKNSFKEKRKRDWRPFKHTVCTFQQL